MPTTTCTPLRSLAMSSRTAVPPTQACTSMAMKSPNEISTFIICCASSRVGASTSAWHSRMEVSMDCRMLMANVAVLPVPVG